MIKTPCSIDEKLVGLASKLKPVRGVYRTSWLKFLAWLPIGFIEALVKIPIFVFNRAKQKATEQIAIEVGD